MLRWSHRGDGAIVRICILTRGDLFPTDHGAAVKIVRTAEALATIHGVCFVVTDDRESYLRFDSSGVSRRPFPERTRAAEEWPLVGSAGIWADRILARIGYPAEEHFLYQPMLDPAWWMRAIAVGTLENIDVFQAEFPGYGVPAWIAARFLGVRSSIVQHNVEWDRLAEFGHEIEHIRRAEQWVLGRVDDVIAVSQDDKDRMVSAGTPADAITVIPHGVDLERFQRADGEGIRGRFGIPEDVPLLMFHGTLHYWPNTEAVRFIVESLLPPLLEAYPGLKIMVAGQNPPPYYAHPAVITPGSVGNIEQYVAAADVCICPIFAGGGTRMKLLEYMAGGKAIVSTTKGAEGIAYQPGEHMLIADSADAMVEQILFLLRHPKKARSMGQRAARFARAYDWSVIGHALTAVYGGEGRGEDWNARFAGVAPVAPVDHHLPRDRALSKPRTLLLLINEGCNLRCSFCDLWQNFENMDVHGRLVPLLDEAVAIGTQTLVITGGEPFIHPDLFVAVAEAKARGLSVNITTNGTLVDKRWDEVVASGVDSLSFSIDGMGPSHDQLRGQEGAFRRTVAALQRVRSEAPHISTSVYCVVTNRNVHEVTAVYDLARSHGAGFDFWPVNDAEDLYLRTPAEQRAWRAAVAHIGAQEPEVASRAAYYEAALAYHGGVEGPVRCLGLVDQYGVTYRGDLLPCCVWGGDGLVVGNVFETPLRELWRSDEVQKSRLKMFEDGCDVGCYNHSLYEFEVATGAPFRLETR